jgi:hypothetical protein
MCCETTLALVNHSHLVLEVSSYILNLDKGESTSLAEIGCAVMCLQM